MKIAASLFCCLSFFLFGCTTTKPPVSKPPVHTVLLDFLEDGKTTKVETFLKLGLPSGVFEKETILTYRLSRPMEDRYYVIDYPVTWQFVHFSLVLVFDEHGVLRKHSMVPVR